jgi:hypothetical protein
MTNLDNKLSPQAQCLLQQRLPPQRELRVQNQGEATFGRSKPPRGSTRAESGLRVAAVCQVVADLWSGPGRGPQEAQALLQWMAEHEAQWRNLDRPPAQEP